MTATDLREFVADTTVGEDFDLTAVRDALSQAFTVREEPGAAGSGTHRRTWLDTFDWRLYKAGLTLHFEQARRGGRLVLSKADGTPQAEQPVTRWPRRPGLAEDLPAGPVRDRIAVLTSPRALLPIVKAVSTVSVTRLLNADGKTVARLLTDHVTVTAPTGNTGGGTTAELPPRLAVAEVRGYPGQARKAMILLAGVPGVSHASQSVFTAALTALGRHPADYSSSVEAEITATMPAPVAVARLLLRLLDTLELNVDGVLRDIDTEFLHDLRVAVRRTRSAIKLLGAVLPADLAEHFKGEFKWLGDVTTPVRDLDVHLLGFDALTGQLVAASPARPGAAARLPGPAPCPRVPAAGRGAARAAVPRHHRRLAQGAARDPRRRRPAQAPSLRGRAGPVHDRALVPAGRRARRRDHHGLTPRIPA